MVRAPQTGGFMATMEMSAAEEEEVQFEQLPESRQGGAEHNVTPGGDRVAWLNASRGRVLGPARTQEVQRGDSIRLSVHGKYTDEQKGKANIRSFIATGAKDRLLTDLLEFGQAMTRSAEPNAITVFNIIDLLAKNLQQKDAPEAYMMYALYDSDSVLYKTGKQVFTKNAANRHEVLEEDLYISEDGYMEAFLVNETQEDVWFDDFSIQSTSSFIVQETHYDPWGLELTGLGFQAGGGVKVNRYLYQGKEWMDDQNLNIYDFEARGYDPVIGRTWQLDPHGDKYSSMSPYSWVANNPVMMIDPDGKDFIIWYTDDKGKQSNFRFIGTNADGAPNDDFVQQFISAYNYNVENGGGEKMQGIATNNKIAVGVMSTEYESGHIGGNIYWNPELGAEYKNATVSPATVLEHESDHALEFKTAPGNHKKGVAIPDSQYTNKEEWRVITGSEQKTARSNREVPANGVTRTGHSGRSVITSGPTSNRKNTVKTEAYYKKLKEAQLKSLDKNW
ncbi:MAG TPA: RHS repeat-associated core domain-containing protein [Cyclobacteriaceae bacterium]|nr:RHS repeat-associated core domain-containing protein [Cyclobacteriaceae bacterium]